MCVSWVRYGGLFDDLNYELVKKYLLKGLGLVFFFGVEGGCEVGERFIGAVDLCLYFVNVGDIKTFVIYFGFIIYC